MPGNRPPRTLHASIHTAGVVGETGLEGKDIV
jgi:hypothetical protein